MGLFEEFSNAIKRNQVRLWPRSTFRVIPGSAIVIRHEGREVFAINALKDSVSIHAAGLDEVRQQVINHYLEGRFHLERTGLFWTIERLGDVEGERKFILQDETVVIQGDGTTEGLTPFSIYQQKFDAVDAYVGMWEEILFDTPERLKSLTDDQRVEPLCEHCFEEDARSWCPDLWQHIQEFTPLVALLRLLVKRAARQMERVKSPDLWMAGQIDFLSLRSCLVKPPHKPPEAFDPEQPMCLSCKYISPLQHARQYVWCAPHPDKTTVQNPDLTPCNDYDRDDNWVDVYAKTREKSLIYYRNEVKKYEGLQERLREIREHPEARRVFRQMMSHQLILGLKLEFLG
jgi:hypothetical protein